jgi:3-hydroxyacyl-CoA dehydrogenase / enoyl-CoA hydratase / 3-hydroxybutyryl-CoA epimerase
MSSTHCIDYAHDDQGIVTLTFNAPGEPVNTMNEAFKAEFVAAVARLEENKAHIKGVILASAKSTFFAGGDLRSLIQAQPHQAQAFYDNLQTTKGAMRRLETWGVPVVAAVNGSALGGGLELVLSCHHRIAIDDNKIQIGFPEVTLGLLPGAGGVVKSVRIMGIQAAMPLLTEGKRLTPSKAVQCGWLHQLVNNATDLLPAARTYIMANPQVKQIWDDPKYKIPGGTASSASIAPLLSMAPAMVVEKTRGNYPAVERILATMVESTQVDVDTALRIESRHFTELAVGQVSKNMIGTFFFQMNEVKAGKSRPAGIAKRSANKVGIVGAGMMGSAIAWACANKGVPCVLVDTDLARAQTGKDYCAKLLAQQVEKNRITAQQAQQQLALIHTSESVAQLIDCDLVIEAVFENQALKAKITKECEAVISPQALMCSNTSTLPITTLAKASSRPTQFIGLHFFSPVEKMPLVEIIKGAHTDQASVAFAFDFVAQLGKTPILVNDGHGFYTSRVFGTYVNEGLALLGEGVPAALVENAGQQVGMPDGPLAVLDEVSLKLADDVLHQELAQLEAAAHSADEHHNHGHHHDHLHHEHDHDNEHDHDHSHDHQHEHTHDHAHQHEHAHHQHAQHKPHKHTVKSKRMPESAVYVLEKMAHGYKRLGRAYGAGFYDYEGTSKVLWPGLKTFERGGRSIQINDIKDRLLYAQAIETCRCLAEGIVESTRDANIGSIMGWGFPGYTGGTAQFVNHVGITEFIARADQLAAQYGERFSPPQWLRDRAASGLLV